MSSPLNSSKSECFIDVPVTLLIGEKSAILLNMVVNIGLMFMATLGNFSILFSFVLVSSLRTTSNYLLLGLALTDLGVGLVVHPLYIFVQYQVYKNTVPNCIIMTAYSISTSFLAGVSLLYITTIGLDRFLAIRLHLRYGQFVTEKRVNLMQLSIWVITSSLSFVWLEGFQVYSTLAAIVVVVSLLATFAVYIDIYLVVRRHKTQIHNQMEAQSAEQGEISRLKKLRRSAINTLYVFFVFLICYLPFFVMTTINNMSSAPSTSAVLLYEFTVTLMLCNSSLNPLMYCLRLRDFRSAVRKTYRRIICLDSTSE